MKPIGRYNNATKHWSNCKTKHFQTIWDQNNTLQIGHCMCNCERVYNWRATSKCKDYKSLGRFLGYSMHAKINARIIYRFESWNRTCRDACSHTPYCHSISLIVHWKHCNLLLPVELKYKMQPTTNIHQTKQQWTFTSLQWIMLNYDSMT